MPHESDTPSGASGRHNRRQKWDRIGNWDLESTTPRKQKLSELESTPIWQNNTKVLAMKKGSAGTLALAAWMILAPLSLAAALAGCSRAPCERAGNCYQPPTTFYSGSYYDSRGGFVFVVPGGKSR